MAKYLDLSGLRRFKNKLSDIFQSKLVSGTNIKTINNESILGEGNIGISQPTKTSDLTNDSGFINKDVNDLTHYTLAVDAGSFIDLDINSTTYVVTLSLKNSSGTVISSDSIDLPLESVVVNGEYDSTNKKIVLTLQSGSTIDIPVGDLISGLQTEITSSNKLASDLVDDTNQVNKFVSTTEKNTWNAKQDVLVSGTNIKTINNESILGSGDIDTSVSWGDIGGTLSDQSDLNSAFNSKQDALISGTNIKTINNESMLGVGDISITGKLPSITTATNIWELEEGIYDVESGVNLYYKSSGYVTTSSYGAFLFVGHESSNRRPFYLMGRDPLTSSGNYNYIYVGVAQNNTYGIIDSYNLRAISSAVTLYDNQTISSKKTFSTLPESSVVPTTDNQLVNKKYVDDNVGGTDEVFYISTTHDSRYTSFDLSGLSKGLYVFDPLSSDVATYVSYGSNNSGLPISMNTPRILIVPEDIEPYESNTYSSGDVLAYYYCLGVGNTESVISYVTRLTYSTTYVYHLETNSSTYFENRFVNLTGAQSIGGVKTFGDYPVIGSFSGLPTTDNQFTPKKYVDNSFFDIVAPNYSSSSTYDVGDFVIHEGLMYTCNTTISTAESWDSTHWTQTSVNENFGGGSTPLDDIPTFDFTSCTWPAYSWISGRYAPTGNNFQKSTARVLYESFVEVASVGKKTYIGYTGVDEYPFIYPYNDNYSKYINRTASSTVTYGFKLPICSPQVTNSTPFVVGYVVASFQVKYDENKDFVEIITNPYPQWWYSQTAYAVQDLTGTFRYTISSSTSDRYVPVYRMYVEDNFLSKTNTTSYTPTTSYNPATKKYVDDNSGWYNVVTDGSETKAGYQIDGQDVYVKRFALNSVVNGSSVAHGLTNFTLVDYTVMADIDGVYRKLPYASGVFYVVDVTSTDISFYTNNSSYTSANLTVSIFYTKNV